MSLEKIEKAIAWYQSIPADFNDIDMLLNCRRKLSTRLFELSIQLASLGRQRNAAEHARKSFEARRRYELTSAEEKPVQAKIAAQVTSEAASLFASESISDAEYTAAKLIYQAAMNVCDVMNQHIANLRSEKSREMINSASQF